MSRALLGFSPTNSSHRGSQQPARRRMEKRRMEKYQGVLAPSPPPPAGLPDTLHTHTPAEVFNTGLWGLCCFQRTRASRGHRPLQWEQGEHREYMTWSLQSSVRKRPPAGPVPMADPVHYKDNGGVTWTVSGFPSLSAGKGAKSLDNSYPILSPISSRCPREDSLISGLDGYFAATI